MKTPKVDWPNKKETDKVLDATGMTKTEIEQRIEDAIAQGQTMAKRGVGVIAPILDGDRKTWESAWNRNETLTKWFGKVTKANHVKDVHRRLDGACDRLANHVLKVNVKAELPKDFHAQNLGGPLSPDTFKVAPEWITMEVESRAAVIIHELLHMWFIDQKIDGESVYGDDMALQLARDNPDKARRSPENYEQFCRALEALQDQVAAQGASGSTTVGSRRR